MAKNVVCVSGYPAAGKSTVTSYLLDEDYPVVVMGDIVREKAEELAGINPENGEEVGEWAVEHRQEEGKNIFARYTMDRVRDFDVDTIIIDGLRDPTELELFESLGSDVYLFFVTAPLEMRYNRITERGRDQTEAEFTLEEFKVRDNREREGGLDTLAQNCDEEIHNIGTEKELYSKIDSLIEEYNLS
jgi:dephospho-CoA kinase